MEHTPFEASGVPATARLQSGLDGINWKYTIETAERMQRVLFLHCCSHNSSNSAGDKFVYDFDGIASISNICRSGGHQNTAGRGITAIGSHFIGDSWYIHNTKYSLSFPWQMTGFCLLPSPPEQGPPKLLLPLVAKISTTEIASMS